MTNDCCHKNHYDVGSFIFGAVKLFLVVCLFKMDEQKSINVLLITRTTNYQTYSYKLVKFHLFKRRNVPTITIKFTYIMTDENDFINIF